MVWFKIWLLITIFLLWNSLAFPPRLYGFVEQGIGVRSHFCPYKGNIRHVSLQPRHSSTIPPSAFARCLRPTAPLPVACVFPRSASKQCCGYCACWFLHRWTAIPSFRQAGTSADVGGVTSWTRSAATLDWGSRPPARRGVPPTAGWRTCGSLFSGQYKKSDLIKVGLAAQSREKVSCLVPSYIMLYNIKHIARFFL